jgi:hypothetical protein
MGMLVRSSLKFHICCIYWFSFVLFWVSNHFAGNSLRSSGAFFPFSLVLSFQDLSLILTYICLNIEDNVNFKLGGVLIVCLIA